MTEPRGSFEHARDSMLVVDATTGQIIDANAAAEEAYGFSRDELLARSIFALRAPDLAPVGEQMRAADAQGILFETMHQRRDGTCFPVEVSSRGHAVDGRRLLFSVIRDITERKRLEAERERALAMRDEFLVVASHELRSPITNVSLQLQQLVRLIERGTSDPKPIGAAATAALAETARLSTLVCALLDAQVVADELVLERAEVDLAALVGDVVARVRARAGSEIVVDVPVLHGRWDRLRLDQVISNLVVNAVKYGGNRPIEIAARAHGRDTRIEIRDRGIGIGREDQTRIFDKYARAVPASYGGIGLGLYIARQLVEAHGGALTVESTLGEGSVFRVSIPTM